MTITLHPETEAKLCEKAQREGRTVDWLVNALLAGFLEQEAREQLDPVAAIQEGFDAGAAGREKPLEQYVAEQRARRGLPDSWPSRTTISELEPGMVAGSE